MQICFHRGACCLSAVTRSKMTFWDGKAALRGLVRFRLSGGPWVPTVLDIREADGGSTDVRVLESEASAQLRGTHARASAPPRTSTMSVAVSKALTLMPIRDLVASVASFLDAADLCRMCRVNTAWRRAIDLECEPQWRSLFDARFGAVHVQQSASWRLSYAVAATMAAEGLIHVTPSPVAPGPARSPRGRVRARPPVATLPLCVTPCLQVPALPQARAGALKRQRRTVPIRVYNSHPTRAMLVRLRTTNPMLVSAKPHELLLQPRGVANVGIVFNASKRAAAKRAATSPPRLTAEFLLLEEKVSSASAPGQHVVTSMWAEAESEVDFRGRLRRQGIAMAAAVPPPCDLRTADGLAAFMPELDKQPPLRCLRRLFRRVAAVVSWRDWVDRVDGRVPRPRRTSVRLLSSLVARAPRAAARVLGYLSAPDLGRCAAVSRAMARFARSDACRDVYCRAFERRFRVRPARVDDWYTLCGLAGAMAETRSLHIAQLRASLKVLLKKKSFVGVSSATAPSDNATNRIVFVSQRDGATSVGGRAVFPAPVLSSCESADPFSWSRFAESKRSQQRSPRRGIVASCVPDVAFLRSPARMRNRHVEDDAAQASSPRGAMGPQDEEQSSRVEIWLRMYNSHATRRLAYRFRIARPRECFVSNGTGILDPGAVQFRKISLKYSAAALASPADFHSVARVDVQSAYVPAGKLANKVDWGAKARSKALEIEPLRLVVPAVESDWLRCASAGVDVAEW